MKTILTLTLILALAGCGGPTVVLHPISPEHIQVIKAGAWPDGPPTKDGFFVSNYYMKEVMQAKVTPVED